MKKKWLVRKQTLDNTYFIDLLAKTKLPREILNFLNRKGYITVPQINKLISPIEEDFFSQWCQGTQMTDFLKSSLSKKIGIYSDYDCDGICASALAAIGLRQLGFNTINYANNRFASGYGLSLVGIEYLLSQGIEILLCIDLGISNRDEISYAQSKGLKVLVIDHHLVTVELPKATIVVDPWSDDEHSNLKSFCSTALVYQLLQSFNSIDFRWMLGYVAIATLADVMELIATNRFYVIEGLKQINTGIYPMYQVIRNDLNKVIDEDDLRFYIIPRINAVGRMEKSIQLALDFCLSDNVIDATRILARIDEINQRRKKLTNLQFEIALKQINPNDVVNVLVGDFHEGLVGLLAGKIKSLTEKTTIILVEKNGILSGSLRANINFSFTSTMESISHLLIQYGGHAAAGGLSLKVENIDFFKSALNNIHYEYEVEDTLYLDCVYYCNKLTLSSIEQWDFFMPYGPGFDYPVFGLVLIDYRYQIFKEKYIRLTCGEIEVMAFDSIEFLSIVASLKPIKVIVKLAKNKYNKYQAVLVESEIRYLSDVAS